MADMNKISTGILIVLVVIASIPSTATASEGANVSCKGETWTGVKQDLNGEVRVEYTITFNQESGEVCVLAENTGEKESYVGYSLSVDGRNVPTNTSIRFSPGETFSATRNITTWMDITAENHTVSIGTYAGTAEFNFTQPINESKEGGIPTPYISDIEVIRNHSTEEVFLEVTATHRGNFNYSYDLLVKTFETGNIPPIGNHTANKSVFRTKLEESPNETVVGDLKLFDDWRTSDGKFDHVEFVSKPNGNLTTWDTKFKEIPPVRVINSDQTYENESARKYRDQGPDVKPISETESRIGAVLTVALLVGAVWWRQRRKHR